MIINKMRYLSGPKSQEIGEGGVAISPTYLLFCETMLERRNFPEVADIAYFR